MTAVPNGFEILVVEDDAAILSLLQRIGTRKGARVIGVSSVEQALSFLEDKDRLQALRAAFLDINVFGGSTEPVYHRIRSVTRELPLVFMTGHVDKGWVTQVLEEDAFAALLPKPFEVATFASMLGDPLAALPHLAA